MDFHGNFNGYAGGSEYLLGQRNLKAQIVREIQALYEAGAPLFTKDAIRKIGDEVKLFKQGEPEPREITLRGVNGVDYKQFVVPPARSLSYDQTPCKWNPLIYYESIEALTIWEKPYYHSLENAYLPMTIAHGSESLDEEEAGPSTGDLRRAFQDVQRQWMESEYQENLRAMLNSLEIPFTLDKVVAFALGGPTLGPNIDARSITQHALVSTIHSTLLQRGVLSKTSKRYVQDPAYNRTEKDVLVSEGFTILDDPEGFLTMDDSSILVSISPNVPVKQIVTDICRPGIIIWDKGGFTSRAFPMTDPDSSRVTKMLEEEYHGMDLPFHECFSPLKIYIRKSS
ncbi:hypothetical protein F5Y04DRAFT_283047 [Hypomontagnella monticulosa]|nr:hypothetical protein F5Y04DRAFT_283047 [Hypomontagnella monticulosa]